MEKLKFEAKRLKYFIWFFTILFSLNLIFPEGLAGLIGAHHEEGIENHTNFLNVSQRFSVTFLTINLLYLSLIKHMEKTIIKLSKSAE